MTAMVMMMATAMAMKKVTGGATATVTAIGRRWRPHHDGILGGVGNDDCDHDSDSNCDDGDNNDNGNRDNANEQQIQLRQRSGTYNSCGGTNNNQHVVC